MKQLSEAQWAAICARYGNLCAACGEAKRLTHDHVVPKSNGGSSTRSNIQPLCEECNQAKGVQTIDYRIEEGRRWKRIKMMGKEKYQIGQVVGGCGIKGTVTTFYVHNTTFQRVYTVRTADGQPLFITEPVIDALIAAQMLLDEYARQQKAVAA